jgi:hypothetical protein
MGQSCTIPTYTFTEREKLKLAFPLDDNHILRVSMNKKEEKYGEIIRNILQAKKVIYPANAR